MNIQYKICDQSATIIMFKQNTKSRIPRTEEGNVLFESPYIKNNMFYDTFFY